MKKINLAILCSVGVLGIVNAQTNKDKITYTGTNDIALYTTASNSDLRLAASTDKTFTNTKQPLETDVSVFVYPDKQFQTFVGIGGAITDASAEVFAKLPKSKQEELLQAYYSTDNGIGYTLMRTNIHSCDFSSESYTYVAEGDKELKTFDIAHDFKYRIPMIKSAMEVANHKVDLFVSPWSPPAFMKSNKSMLKGGKLLPEYRESWANYYVKFINAYEKAGIPIWGLTIQNEPMATQRWESCIYTATEERDFLRDYLGPALEKNGLSNKKVIVWDHNRDLMNQRAEEILADPGAAKYVWGVGFHWYENWSGGEPMFENVQKVQDDFPDTHLVFTEGCNESFNKKKYEYWPNAERYGESMINDFNHGTVAWTDWNILLDETGGPNHVGNLCFAPIHADTKKGKLIYTPSYYYLGHFSKFIKPGAKRISSAVSRSSLISTSFINTTGEIVTVVMNKTDKELKYGIYINEKKSVFTIPPHAMQTIVY